MILSLSWIFQFTNSLYTYYLNIYIDQQYIIFTMKSRYFHIFRKCYLIWRAITISINTFPKAVSEVSVGITVNCEITIKISNELYHIPCLCKRPLSHFAGENFFGDCHLQVSKSLCNSSSCPERSVIEVLLAGFILGIGPGDRFLAKVIHREAVFVVSHSFLARGDDSRRNFVTLTCGNHL